MSFTFENIMFALLTAMVLFVLWRTSLSPVFESWLTKLRHKAVDHHCPLQLVKALWVYRKGDGELDVPAEVMKFLKSYFSWDVIHHAICAARYGQVDIYVDSWKTSGEIRYKYLAVGFENGELAYAYFHEPRSGGKTGL